MSNPADFVIENDVPPPYTPYGEISYPSSRPTASLFASHLAGLRSQIAAEQAAQASVREEQDAQVLSLLVPHIEDFLSSIAGMHPTPRLVEAIFVPDQAVESSWQLSDEVEDRPGTSRQVVRVGAKKSKESHGKGKSRDAYDRNPPATAATLLWWSDGSVTRRLAKLLQPQQAVVSHRSTVTQRSGSGQEGKSRWGLFNFKKANGTSQPDDGVSMTVRAEETTFRKENDFGLWESCTGWALVVRVRIARV